MSVLLLFPNQLFNNKIINKIIKDFNIESIYFIEHPLYFGYDIKVNKVSKNSKKKYKFNKLKIIYHLACNIYYKENILHKFNNKYISLNNFNGFQNIIKPDTKIVFFNTLNEELNNLIISLSNKENIKMLNTPLLLSSLESLDEYYKKHKNKKQNHSSFYKWQKQKLNILTTETKTYDIQQKLPNNINIPKLPKLSSEDNKYIKAGIKEFQKYQELFKDNYGPLNDNKDEKQDLTNNFIFPVTHNGAIKYLNNFLKYKFNDFGNYQDSILNSKEKHDILLFHSGLSPMLNLGLILPHEILDKLKSNKYQTQIKPYEAFIRQIIGWREYQYYIYKYYKNTLHKNNYFNNTNKLNDNWYKGTINILPVDNCITYAFNYGYLHHILRLMIMCNFMNLCMIHPHEVFKWFMEFSLDSYEWVMYCNVYSMGLWSDGGIAMRKPYIASDNYINKMSNYNNKEKWNNIWYSLFYNFIYQKSDKLKKTYYVNLVKYWDKKDNSEQNNIKKTANLFLKNYQMNDKSNGEQKIINGGNYELKNIIIKKTVIELFNNNKDKIFSNTYFNSLNKLKEYIKNYIKKNIVVKNIEFKLYDVILNHDNELNKIWFHGDEKYKLDNIINSITAGLKGNHYYIIIVNNNIIPVGNFSRNY